MISVAKLNQEMLQNNSIKGIWAKKEQFGIKLKIKRLKKNKLDYFGIWDK